jgi:ribosomal protein S5
VDKAGKTVGVGIAMASDVAGAVKTAIGVALTTVTEVLKSTPVKKPAKRTAPKKGSQKDISEKGREEGCDNEESEEGTCKEGR